MRDHRSLKAWQEARKLSGAALRLCRTYWKPHARALFGQLQRASLSIQLNIAEGYALSTRKMFARHIRIAYGSAVETGEILELAESEGLVPAGLIGELRMRCAQCERLLLGLLKRLQIRE